MANRYWVGGTATWDGTAGTKWSTTSGGAGGSSVPGSSDIVYFDAASGAVTCTISGSRSCLNLVCTGFTGTLAGASSPVLTISGSMTLSTGMTLGTPSFTFNSTATGRTIDTAGKTLNNALTFDGNGGSWIFQSAITQSSGIVGTTLTRGTIDLNNFTLTATFFNSNNSNTRAIAFGTGSIVIAVNSIVSFTSWEVSTATGMTITGTPNVSLAITGSGTMTISNGGTAGGAAATAINIASLSLGSSNNFAFTGHFKDVDLTGLTVNNTVSNTSRTIYGNITFDADAPLTAGGSSTNFSGTSGTQLITSNGKTLDFPINFNGIGGSYQLQDALTVGDTRTTTLGYGTLNLNNFTLTTGRFTSNSGQNRGLTFGTGSIALVSSITAATTIWTVSNTSTLTISGTFNASANITTTNDTATISHTASFGKELNITNLVANSGSTVSLAGQFSSIDFTNFLRVFAATGLDFSGSSLVFNSSMTTSSTGTTLSFVNTSGTQQFTSAGVPVLFDITRSIGSGTLQFQDAISCRILTLTGGTIDLNNLSHTCTRFSSNNTNTRTLAFGTGSISVVDNAVTTSWTAWQCDDATNFSISGTKNVSFSTTSTGTLTSALTINNGNTTGGTSANAINVTGVSMASATPGNLSLQGHFNDVNLSSLVSGNYVNCLARYIYGSMVLSGVATYQSSSPITTFAGTSGIQDFTSNGATVNFPLLIDGIGGTFRLLDAINTPTARTFTVTNGTFNANNFNVTLGRFNSSGTGVRTVTMGSGTWTLIAGGVVVWETSTTTNLTFNKDTANIVLSNDTTSTTARTFNTGGLTFNKLTIGGSTSTSVTLISGNATFSEIDSTKTVKHTITGTSNTITVGTWSVQGASSSAAVKIGTPSNILNVTKSGGGTVTANYVVVYEGTFLPSGDWDGNNTSFVSGATTGWINVGYYDILTTATSSPYTIPSTWNSGNNEVNLFGGGGGAAGSSYNATGTQYAAGAGGGGGGYTKVTNFIASPASTVTFSIGAGGTGGAGVLASLVTGGTGGSTTWNAGAYSASGGLGGTADTSGASPVSTGGTGGTGTTYNGGNGGAGGTSTSSSCGAGGGGGAAGPNGPGGGGGIGWSGALYSGGGGGNGGGTNGGNATSSSYGFGGNNSLGTGGALTTSGSGVDGGGGAGSINGVGVGGNGGAGVEYINMNYGGGGGSGGSNNSNNTALAGSFGGGGGGAGLIASATRTGGSGAAGGIILIWVYTGMATGAFFMMFS